MVSLHARGLRCDDDGRHAEHGGLSDPLNILAALIETPRRVRSLNDRFQRMAKSLDVVQGTLDLLIMKALSIESFHGWGISARIQELSGDVFQVGQGSLYPALHRLENKGWVTSYWKTTSNNRIARWYQLTPEGRAGLADEIASWRRYAGAMEKILGA